jgi:hypothetical protein
MAADLAQLRLLSTHLPFDTMHLRCSADAVHALQERMAALLPALSAVEDRLQALREAEAAPAPDVDRSLAQLRH